MTQEQTPQIDITKLKPSQLINLALIDMRICELDPRYGFYMGKWHAPKDKIPYKLYHDFYPDAECFVCMAGAVMAQTKQIPIDSWKTVNDFSVGEEKAFAAIDHFRDGQISTALFILGYHDHYPGLPNSTHVTNYLTYNPGVSIEINYQFYADMLNMVKLLEDHNL